MWVFKVHIPNELLKKPTTYSSRLNSQLFLNVLALCSKSNFKNCNSLLLQEVLTTRCCSCSSPSLLKVIVIVHEQAEKLPAQGGFLGGFGFFSAIPEEDRSKYGLKTQ